MSKASFRCHSTGECPCLVEATDDEAAAEIYAADIYYGGNTFEELSVVVTDSKGCMTNLMVRAEPVTSVEFLVDRNDD